MIDNLHPIDELCKEYNLTRYKLSKMSGVAETTLSNLVKRNSSVGRISADTLHAISTALEIDMGDMYKKLKKFENS